MGKGFNWVQFIRIAIGVSLIGVGVAIAGESGGELFRLILGFVCLGIGIAIIFA